MDARITKSRIQNTLSYDWIKILVTIAAAVFVWVTFLSIVSTKPAYQQQMYFIYYKDIYRGDDASALEEKLVDTKDADGVFSYEIMDTSFLYMSSSSTYSGLALSARMAAGNYSMMLVSEAVADEETQTTYLQEFLGSYYPLVEEIDEYFSAAEAYLSPFYGGDIANGELDASYLEEQFRARNKKDKRYRTEKNVQAGLLDEANRIEETRDALLAVLSAVDEGILTLTKTQFTDYEKEETVEGTYAICIGTPRMASMRKVMYLYDEETATKYVDGVNVCFFKMADEDQEYMRFEKLLYVAYLVNMYADKI